VPRPKQRLDGHRCQQLQRPKRQKVYIGGRTRLELPVLDSVDHGEQSVEPKLSTSICNHVQCIS